MCAYVCGNQRIIGQPQAPPIFCLRKGLRVSLACNCPNKLDQLASKPVSLFHLTFAEVTRVCNHTQFLYGFFWDLNSNTHACMASTLLTDFPRGLLHLFFHSTMVIKPLSPTGKYLNKDLALLSRA